MKSYEDEGVLCDTADCGAEIESEELAASSGWLVDHGVEPHRHFCPECRENTVGQ